MPSLFDHSWAFWRDQVFTETNVVLVSSISAAMFLASLFLIPWFIATLPSDYFLRQRGRLWERISQGSVLHGLMLVAKNVLGFLLFLAGIIMLVLPGQGLLTMLVGMIMMDFPKKHVCERWLVERKGVKSSADWLRRKYGKNPFRLHD